MKYIFIPAPFDPFMLSSNNNCYCIFMSFALHKNTNCFCFMNLMQYPVRCLSKCHQRPYLSPLLYNRNVCISVACVSESLSTLLVLHVLFLWINTLPSHWIKFLSLLVHDYCVFPWLNNTEQYFINLNPCGVWLSFLFCFVTCSF